MGWIQAHGGLVAVVLLAVTIFNILVSAAAQVFTLLGTAEPGWLKSIGDIGLKITQWIGANQPTPK